MIIIDYSGVAMSIVFSQLKQGVELDSMRHMILNTLRMYNVKYRKEYGRMIIACDHSSWRKKVYAEYKASRTTNREKSDIDWKPIYEILGIVQDEISKEMPYPVVQAYGAEADDIIGVLVEGTQEFGNHEKVMIVSADKDFIQLQKYSNVKQYSPMTKKLIAHKDPVDYLFEHVLRGDGSDGVPNVLSPDNTFVDAIRQKPLRGKLIDTWRTEAKTKEMIDVLDEDTYANYIRNKTMIDLSYTPDNVVEDITKAYKLAQEDKDESRILNYLIKNRCSMLIGCARDFFTQ